VDGKEDRRVIKSKVDPDFPENSVVEVQQTYGNLDVLFARSKLNIEPSAAVSGLTSSFTPLDSISIEPAIDETKARGLARTEYQRLLNQVPDGPESQIRASEGNAPLETARLVVFDPKLVDAGEGRVRLAWLVQIGNAHLVIDANSGKTLYFYNDAPSVLIQRIFDFEDGTIAPSSPVLDDAVAAPNVTLGVDVGMARDNTKVVYNFLRASFNRDGFDDNDGDGPAGGSPFISYVRLPDLQNARWCPRPGQQCPAKDVMVYGIGYAAALDIVAHEIGHGVIEHEANLAYRGESGALNEAIADIFGALAEPEGPENWLIGENLPLHSAAHPLRNMRDPSALGFDPSKPLGTGNEGQPDNYAKLVKYNMVTQTGDPICKFSTDIVNGCVHFNSGIVDKAVWLLAEGGQNGDVTVQGIGRQKLGRMVYRTLVTGLTQTSGLGDFAAAMAQSCVDLTSTSVTTAADCNSTRAAFQSVGLVPTS
jgi:Zn-dependent metalloprotease